MAVEKKKIDKVVEKPSNQVQVIAPSPGNTDVLMVQLLAAIDRSLAEIKELLKNG